MHFFAFYSPHPLTLSPSHPLSLSPPTQINFGEKDLGPARARCLAEAVMGNLFCVGEGALMTGEMYTYVPNPSP